VSSVEELVNLETITEAQARVRRIAHRTPLQPTRFFSELTGGEVFLKLENMQRTGSFKIRGAYNKLSQLPPDIARRGLVAASAGNHAQGVALAASALGYQATIVMPINAPLSKLEATRNYGAEVILEGVSYQEAYTCARKIAAERQAVYIHAFNDPHIIAGQGTIGLELLADLPDVETIIVPVGGGGLISGIAVAVHALQPRVRVIGVQAAGAPAMQRSLTAGEPTEIRAVATIADGIAIKRPGDLTFELLRQHVEDVVTVDDETIAYAIMLLLERNKLLVEGAGAVGVAALLAGKLDLRGQKTAVVISGGNIDLNILSQVIARGLGAAGRYLRFFTRLPDRPGALAALLQIVARAEGNVISVTHDRLRSSVGLGQTGVEILVETASDTHQQALLERLRAAGYQLEIVAVAEPQSRWL